MGQRAAGNPGYFFIMKEAALCGLFFLCLNILGIFILFCVDILANIGYNKDTVKGGQRK